jgi:hypothetical protein
MCTAVNVLQVFATCLALAGDTPSETTEKSGNHFFFCFLSFFHAVEVPVLIMANFGLHWGFGHYVSN